MLSFFPGLCRSRVKSGMSFSAGAVFSILLFFFTKSFAFVVSYSLTDPGPTLMGNYSVGAYCNYYERPGNFVLPPGSSIVRTNVFVSMSCSGQDWSDACSCSFSGSNSSPGSHSSINVPVYCSGSSSGLCTCGGPYGPTIVTNYTCVYEFDSPDPPPCSDPVPVPDNRCEGGQGLGNLTGFNSFFGGNCVQGEGTYAQCPNGAVYWAQGPVLGSINFPNGSSPYEFDNFGNSCILDVPTAREHIACPLGFASGSSSSDPSSSSSFCDDPRNEEDPACACYVNPNSVACQNPPVPSSSSGSDLPSPSSSSGDICIEFPTLPQCECHRNPGLPWCSGASSGSSPPSPSSSSGGFDLCTEFPSLIFCQSSDSGGGSSGGSGNGSFAGSPNNGGVWGGSGNGGSAGSPGGEGTATCLKNNNCNWARIDVQLNQLGVETQTRDLIKDIASLQQAGYNLSNEQNILLHSVLQAVNNGSADVVKAIDNLASRISSSDSSNSDNFNSSLTKWGDMLNETFGENGSKLDNISSKLGEKLDSLRSFFGKGTCEGDDCNPAAGVADTSGLRSKANSMISGGGKGFAPWSDSQIGALLPSKMSSGQCPVIDKPLKFFGKQIPFRMDFNNLVPGSEFDLAKFMRACLLITVYIINTMSMIAIFRSGGRS